SSRPRTRCWSPHGRAPSRSRTSWPHFLSTAWRGCGRSATLGSGGVSIRTTATPTTEARRVNEIVADLESELIAVRRRIHAHPELSRMEHGTTSLVAERLREEGLRPRLLTGTGLVCDIGPDPAPQGRRRIALRADLD